MPKLCPKCGAIYGDDDRFCHIDGTRLEDHPVSPPPTGSHPVPAVRVDSDKYLGKTLLGQFEIFEKCGSGSMGTVYKARQSEIDRVVAIKILHPQLANQPEAVLRFHREAKVISNLNHPNIVHIYLFGHLPDGNLYIVQEFVDGRSLASEMKKSFGVSRTIHIAKQVLSAIGEAHAGGVIHRDLKPENIMLAWVGEDRDFVKILDFGVAKKIVTQTFATREGLIFGSPRYISPEAAMGEKIDVRSDLYSLGVILYQMLSGEAPFRGETPIELLMAHINAQPLPLRSRPGAGDVPPELESVIMKLLAKDPQRRYPTASATREALAAVERLAGGVPHYAHTEQTQEPGFAGAPQQRRLPTAQASDSFSSYTKKDLPPVNGSAPASYADYTTQEDVIGTQELYALQMRREKMKKAAIAVGIIMAVPILLVLAYFGYTFMKEHFFPYDKLAAQQIEKPKKETVPAPAEPAEKKQEPEQPAPEAKEPPSVDITLENENIPEVGMPAKLVAILTNEEEPAANPHFLIKEADGQEIKLSAVELLGQGKGKRKFTADFEFPESGPHTVTFASSERKYSPSVRIHVQEKTSGKKKGKGTKKGGKPPIIIKEIEPAKETDVKSKEFGPDIAPPDSGGTSTEPPKGIKIIEQPGDKSWY